MSSYDLGREFEIVTQDFFLWLFDAIEVQVNNYWIQKAGYQFGFDVGFEIAVLKNDFFKRGIYIECKNYEKTVLEKTQLHEKLLQFDMSSYENKNSIFIFLSPKVDLKNCTQDSNPVLLENYFNNKLEIKTIILTPNNNIQRIFALNEEIYYRVYGEQLLIEKDLNDNNIILNYFKKLLFSKGEIPNFNLEKERKNHLKEASNIDIKNLYVERKLKTNKFSFFQEDKSLIELLKENDNILLLGEPGSGKTTELQNVAKYFEEKISILGITPIFLNLSDIKEFNNIEDLLPDKWDSNNRIILLLDSFDEFELKSKLSEQIEKLLKLKDISFKIIISCRTYAYNEELSSFKPNKFYLDRFNNVQTLRILNQQYHIPIEEFDKIDKNKFKDILEDPFMLSRFGVYFEKNQSIPKEINEIYADVISELKSDDVEVYKIFALILELTRNISIQKDELRSLFGLKYKRLINLKFIQKSFDKQSFKFTHKNYQEYFAALALTELTYEKIISFILIKGTNKTHPSFFNTITFLINILESEKCDLLIQWFVDNEPELLFKADKNRISDNLREQTFQDYFKKECIEKGFWINTNRTFSVSEIARFGNVPSNIEYLINIIKGDYHFRVIISALDLLSFFKIERYEKELKQLFLKKLKDNSTSIGIKSQLLLCSNALKFETDAIFFDEVYSLMKNEDSNEINSAFLNFIHDREDVDSIFDYLLEEFKRIHNISKRLVPDEVLRGNGWKVSKLILKLNDSNNFIDLITYYFQDDIHIDLYSGDDVELLNKCIQFAKNDEDFIIKLLKTIIGKTNYYTNDKLLKEIIKNSNQIKNAVRYLIDKEVFSKVDYFMSSFIDEESLIVVKDNYINGKLVNEDIERLRNFIWSNGNPELSQIFNDLMIENGFNSEKTFYTIKQINKIQLEQKVKHQSNFDILFDPNVLFAEIVLLFTKYNITAIDNEIILKIENDWYELNGYWSNSINSSIVFLKNLTYEYGTLSLDKLKEIINEKDEVFYLIKSKIEGNKNTNLLFNVNEEQILKIKTWSEKNAKSIDFSQVFELINVNSFRYGKDYKKLKTVLFFLEQFNFEFDKEFLLECIKFYEMESSRETESFKFLFDKIDNKERFDNRIVENILSDQLFSIVLTKHINYALDNELSKAYSKIREYFLSDSYEYNLQNQLEKYVKLTKDYEVLKECAVNIKSYKCWSAIKILTAYKKEKEFCCNKALQYLSLETQTDNNFLSNSLDVLFEFNKEEAVLNFLSLLKRDLLVSVLDVSFSNYNAISNFNIIKELFGEIYLKKDGRHRFSNSTNFLNVYISNLSKVSGLYLKVEKELLEIKKEVEDNDTGLFYVNFLIDTAKNSYINSKSEKYSFDEALELVEKIVK